MQGHCAREAKIVGNNVFSLQYSFQTAIWSHPLSGFHHIVNIL